MLSNEEMKQPVIGRPSVAIPGALEFTAEDLHAIANREREMAKHRDYDGSSEITDVGFIDAIAAQKISGNGTMVVKNLVVADAGRIHGITIDTDGLGELAISSVIRWAADNTDFGLANIPVEIRKAECDLAEIVLQNNDAGTSTLAVLIHLQPIHFDLLVKVIETPNCSDDPEMITGPKFTCEVWNFVYQNNRLVDYVTSFGATNGDGTYSFDINI